MNNNMFDQIDFGPLKEYINDDNITDVSYDNKGQIHLKTLSKGIYRVENPEINDAFMEKLAFQCSNVMGKTFNMAHPFLDAESAELRLNFVHDSIATNGIACVIRKTPAKIRLEKEKIIEEKYIEPDIHDFLEYCVKGHCNIIACGETGSGKTELVKYLASKIAEDEKVITIEDTLELHLDRIFPHRDIVAMKTNNIASYTDVLVTCMRQNPKWILLSEVRSAEAVLAVRNSISSGHYILSTIHADKAASIPNRMYSLLETNQDIEQFLKTIHRYVQIGIYVRGYTDKQTHHFVREIAEVTEFYVDKDNNAKSNMIYRKGADGKVIRNNPSPYLIDYLEVQGVYLPKELELLGENVPISEGRASKPNSNGVIPDLEEFTTDTSSDSLNTEAISTPNVVKPSNVDVPKVEENIMGSSEVLQPNIEQPSMIEPNMVNNTVNQSNMTQSIPGNTMTEPLQYGEDSSDLHQTLNAELQSTEPMTEGAVMETASNPLDSQINASLAPKEEVLETITNQPTFTSELQGPVNSTETLSVDAGNTMPTSEVLTTDQRQALNVGNEPVSAEVFTNVPPQIPDNVWAQNQTE